MIIKIVVLYLLVANCDTGEYLYNKRIEMDGFSVSGNRIEDCRIVGVEKAKEITAYFRQWYPNASTNVDCQWEVSKGQKV